MLRNSSTFCIHQNAFKEFYVYGLCRTFRFVTSQLVNWSFCTRQIIIQKSKDLGNPSLLHLRNCFFEPGLFLSFNTDVAITPTDLNHDEKPLALDIEQAPRDNPPLRELKI